MPDRLDWLDLWLFDAVARLGSIKRAAAEIEISQPNASKRMRTLEGLVGSPLFIRGPNGVTLTERAQSLTGLASTATASMRAFRDAITGNVTTDSPVRIFAPLGMISAHFAKAFSGSLEKTHPFYENFIKINWEDLPDWLFTSHRDSADITVDWVSTEKAEENSQSLKFIRNIPYVPFASSEYLLKNKIDRFQDLNKYTLIHQTAFWNKRSLSEWLKQVDLAKNGNFLEVDTGLSAINLADSGTGIALLPLLSCRLEKKIEPLKLDSVKNNLSLFVAKSADRRQTKEVSRLFDAIYQLVLSDYWFESPEDADLQGKNTTTLAS